MNLYIMNGLSGITGIVEVFESMIWNMQFYSVNDFQVILPLTSDAAALLQPGILLVREPDVGSGEYHNVMRIENRTISFNLLVTFLSRIARYLFYERNSKGYIYITHESLS